MSMLEKIAVLIDADNTQLAKLELALQEISTHGRIVVKRAYGNWKKDTLKNWEDEVKRLAIKTEQQFDYVTGKNATDMALVIDAIGLLNSSIYDAFAIVSSDSDFTPLAIKLHESGLYVFGVGEKKTPESFRNSCDEFIFLENLAKATAAEDKKEEVHTREPLQETDITVIHALLRKAFDTYQEDNGYVYASSAGAFIKRAKPDFDSRTYGFANLTQLIEAFPDLYQTEKTTSKGNATIVTYRCK